MAITIKAKLHNKETHKMHNGGKILGATLSTAWKISPKLTSSLVKQIFFQTKKYKLSEKEKGKLATAEPFSITVRGKRINGWKWGIGPSILLVHGWNGAALQLHKFIDPLLKQGYSVVAYDGPAHGQSQGSHTSYFEFTDVVRHFINHPMFSDLEGIIGHSMGASAVINAVTKEGITPRLVLFAPALPIKEMLYDTFGKIGIPDQIFSQILHQYELEHKYSIDIDNPIKLVPELKSPTLIIHDENDRATPFSYSRKAAMMNPHLRLLPTKGLGHGRILRNKKLILKSIGYLSQKEQANLAF